MIKDLKVKTQKKTHRRSGGGLRKLDFIPLIKISQIFFKYCLKIFGGNHECELLFSSCVIFSNCSVISRLGGEVKSDTAMVTIVLAKNAGMIE